MVITVTDNRTLVDEADSVTGWSSPVGGNAPASFTADPAPKETTAHNGVQVSNAESELLFTLGASVDLSAGVLVYVWVLGQGIMQTTVNYGIAGLIGDGTNTNAYQIAGGDNAVFRHSSGSSVGYMCMLLDTTSLPTGKALRGTFASLSLTALTEFGADFVTTVKSVGGVENCYIDVIRYGNGGLTIVGTDSASYWMDDLSVLDASSTNSQSYGICRKLGAGSYSFQGQILLGDTGTGADTLRVIDQTFAFEDRSVGTDKYGLTIQGNATGAQAITFTNSNFLVPVGVGAFFLATDVNVENLDVTGCLFTNWDQGFDLSANATNSPNWDWSNNKFVGCSQINSGKTAFKNNTIENTTNANGGWIIDSATSLTNVDTLNFISDGTGHAIYITATGTYTFTDFKYTGYGLDGTTDAVIYNNSGGAVTINVSGGGSPTVRNGAGASTIVNNTQTITINDVLVNEIIGIYRSTGLNSTDVDKSLFTSHATNNTATSVTFEITTTIPTDTPATGTLKIYQRDSSGQKIREDVHTYTSYSGAIFSGLSPVLAINYDNNDTALAPYIEKIVDTVPETADLNYSVDRNLVTVWRAEGFDEFRISGIFSSTGYSTGIVKEKDDSVDLP